MKRKIFSVLLAIVLLASFSLVTVAPVAAVTPPHDRETAILAAADRLVETQDPEGGFEWWIGGGVADNVLGITAIGILKAYELMDKAEYETALAKAYGYAKENTERYVYPDVTYLVWLADAAEADASLLAAINTEVPETTIQDIRDRAITIWTTRMAGGTKGDDGLGLGAAERAVEDLKNRYASYAGLGFWDLGAAVKASLALENPTDANAIAGVMYDNLQSGSPYYFDITNTSTICYVLALSSTIEAFLEVGVYPTMARTMTDELIAFQDETGFWDEVAAPNWEESVQSTAYAVMALVKQGDDDAMIAARKGADWLVKSQLVGGGWNPCEKDWPVELLEADSEAAWALATAPAPVTIGDLGYFSIQSAIDSASTDDTISVAAGTYDELLTINVDGLTLLGAQFDEDPRPTMSAGRSGAEESIIRKTYTTETLALNPIKIEASNVTINGFTISPHYEDDVGDTNGINKDLVKQEPTDSWVGTAIRYNILTATGYNIVDNCDELVQLKGVTGAVIEFNYGYHETAEDSGGNAFNIADGSADSFIQYNEAHLCGDFQYDKWGGAIYTYESDNINVIGNKVVGGSGITFGVSKAATGGGWSRNTGGTVEGNIVESNDDAATFGLEIFADDVTVSGNYVTGCGVYALNIIGLNVTVQGNDLWNSGTGILVEDKADASFSTSGVSINYNNIYGNTSGLENEAAAEVDAINNWWGSINGPTHAGNTFNVGEQGNAVSGLIDYVPWNDTDMTGDSFAPVALDGAEDYSSIQAAINAANSAGGDTVNVAAGTYTEAILIDKPLTLRGATADVNKNGYIVPENYAWDNAVESIINHPDPAGGYIAIVDIVDVDDVNFEGFVVQELNAVANLNSSLIRVKADTQEISDIVVRNNVIGPNTNVTSQDGTHGRMGLYIVNDPYGDLGVISSTFSGNKIFDCKGNGNNVFIWSSYYADPYNAPGPASMSGTVIEDNEIYGSHRSGIETAGGFSGLTIRNNSIYGNSGLDTDEPNYLKYGNGILLIRGSGDKLGGATTAYGPVDLTIENNEIYNNEKNGIYMGPINTGYTITENNIHDNGWDGIMLDLEGQYHNPTFEPMPEPYNEFACFDGSTNIVTNLNHIYSNTEYGVRVVGTPTNGFVLDTTHNWWGHASGPSRELPNNKNDKWVGKGDKVSENVDYKPWLHKSEDVVDEKKPAYAQSVDLDNTGDYGWNTFSAPIFLDEEADTWAELVALSDLDYDPAYRFDSDNQTFVLLTTTDNYTITPGEGFFIKMKDVGSLTILYSTAWNPTPPTRPLTAGWNLIGLANLEEMDVEDAFASIAEAPGLAGYSQVVSPIGNAKSGPVLADGTIYVGESYWVYMLGERTLAGFTMTPVDWVP